MWELTICIVLVMCSVLAGLYLLIRANSKTVSQQTADLANVLTTALEVLVKPVVNPGSIQQVPQSLEEPLYSDPEWMPEWDGGVPERPLTFDPLSKPGPVESSPEDLLS